jgi:hypothetical protein
MNTSVTPTTPTAVCQMGQPARAGPADDSAPRMIPAGSVADLPAEVKEGTKEGTA